MTTKRSVWSGVVLIPIVVISAIAGAGGRQATNPEDEVRQVLSSYIALYQKDTLAAWRRLFLPGFVAAFTNDDGSVTTRTLDEFYERQEKYFATGHAIREELRNIRLTVDGRLASVHADFVLVDNGSERPGRLVLTFVRDRDTYKIHSLAFTYHLDRPASVR